MDERERLARLICQVLHAIDPDTRVYAHSPSPPPVLRPGLLLAPDAHVVTPLWSLYGPAAEAIIEDEHRRKENSRLIRRSREEAKIHQEVKAFMNKGMTFDEAWIASGGAIIPILAQGDD